MKKTTKKERLIQEQLAKAASAQRKARAGVTRAKKLVERLVSPQKVADQILEGAIVHPQQVPGMRSRMGGPPKAESTPRKAPPPPPHVAAWRAHQMHEYERQKWEDLLNGEGAMTVGQVLAAKTTGKPKARYWMGAVRSVDDFGEPIGQEFIDGKTVYGPWAFMAPVSWKQNGVGRLGTGFGQRYQKQKDGRWMKVEG